MQRRSAVKRLAVALGGLVSLPAWAAGWPTDSIGQLSILSGNEEELLGEIVETIIPETTTPGAKLLGVYKFAMRMIRDCYDAPAQVLLQQGLVLADGMVKQTYTKSFIECDAAQRKDVLTKMTTSSDATAKSFVDMIKGLIIQGYMNSEYVLVTVKKYVMAPGFYQGCIPVKV